MKKIKAIFFDLDGVLIDSQKWHYESLNKALNEYGFTISELEQQNIFDGLPTKKKLDFLSQYKGLTQDLHHKIIDKKKEYFQATSEKFDYRQYNHHFTFKQLKNQGYVLAICSNMIRKSVDFFINKLRLIDLVSLSLSNEDVNSAKPDPEIYLKAQNYFGLAGNNCLVLEDNQYGIQSALESGCHVLKITNPLEVNFDNIVSRIQQLED